MRPSSVVSISCATSAAQPTSRMPSSLDQTMPNSVPFSRHSPIMIR